MMENSNTLSEEDRTKDRDTDLEKEEQPESEKLVFEKTKIEKETEKERKPLENEKQMFVAEVDPAKERENETKEETPKMQNQEPKKGKGGMTTDRLLKEDLIEEEEEEPLANEQDVLLVKCEEVINKLHWQEEKLSFLEKVLDVELKHGQERDEEISLLERANRKLSDENVSLKEEIQKLKMGWPTPTEIMSARQCARRMQQNTQQRSEWRAPFGFEKIRQNRHIQICLRCRRQGHHFKDCPYPEFCSYCQRQGHRDATHNVATWACQRE